MSTIPILVKWRDSQEVLKIDFEKMRQGEVLTETHETEIIEGKRKFWRYNTTSTATPHGKGVTLTVYYRRKDNTHLRGHGYRWGHSILELNSQMRRGRIEWFDDHEEYDERGRKYYGDVMEWKRLVGNADLLSKREIETVQRKARQQAKLKSQLMLLAPRCAITGETEEALLEAAHLIAVKNDGADVSENAILLRADLHRLFDAGLIGIGRGGAITLSKNLASEDYRTRLKEARLDDEAFARVRKALTKARRL